MSSPPPPAGTVIPLTNTLPLLTITDSLWVGQQNGSLDYLINGFPQNVAVVSNNLFLSQLSSTDLSFLLHVACVPDTQVSISQNLQLASLAGCNALFVNYGPELNQVLSIVNNPALGQAGLQPLGPALQCDNGVSPVQPFTFTSVVPGDCSVSLASFNSICEYLKTGCIPGPATIRQAFVSGGAASPASRAGLPVARVPGGASSGSLRGGPGDSPAARSTLLSAPVPLVRKIPVRPLKANGLA